VIPFFFGGGRRASRFGARDARDMEEAIGRERACLPEAEAAACGVRLGRPAMILSILLFAAAQGAAPATPAATAAPPPPACSGPEYRALDFWVGEWDLTFTQANGSTGHAVNRITKDEYGDCVISEQFEQADIAFVGVSHSSYDRLKKKWVQTWVDNQGGYITLAGGPVDGQNWTFELDTLEPRGPAQSQFRMIWEKVTADSLTWRWQTQQPDGSWADAWAIDYKRRK
jgi:hypothetical protein